MCSIPLLPSMLGGVTPSSIIREHFARTLVQRHSGTFRTPVENLVDTGEEPVFAFYLDNQVDGELAFGGVKSVHCTDIFVYMYLESTSYWQVNWDGLKLCEAAVEVNCCFVEFVDC